MNSFVYTALGFDPAPGDVAGIESYAASLAAGSAQMREASHTLATITLGQQLWNGPAATEFSRAIARCVPLLHDATTALHNSASALHSWSMRLTELQHRARELEIAARSTDQRITALRAHPILGPGAVITYENQLNAQLAHRELQAALDDLEHLRWRARELRETHAREAAQTAHLLDAAAALAPEGAGFFERLGAEFGRILDMLVHAPAFAWEFVQENAETIAEISTIASDVSTALGLAGGALALVPGAQPVAGALGTGAVALSVAALAGHSLAKAAGADVSWQTITLDAAGVIPAGKIAASSLGRLSDASDVLQRQVGGVADLRHNYLLSLTGSSWAEHWQPRSPSEAALAIFHSDKYAVTRAREFVSGA
ncbi:hypothetical protein ONR57_13875 [Hoyosella sp. YIM 151337]|uniref:hypothetical protein n=1 Tax=Hoyosella sp. YIM 151337 TaxID=2992742 RepID=UPI00223666A3|nr:hypothetical protein [Hoyosella sp. YIM 151337]MCW4354392.1 hypothetical protein [Hoyosella sp. YIM 151337]